MGRQLEGETFADFFVRLKSLSQEIGIFAAHSTKYEKKWIKHGILMGVCHEEMFQRLIAMPATSSL